MGRSAQRRPGAYPRQSPGEHPDPACGWIRSTKAGGLPPAILVGADDLVDLAPQRSTKAGGLPPAIPAIPVARPWTPEPVQRRPGAYPRQSEPESLVHHRSHRRSTKAGGLPPAIPDVTEIAGPGRRRSTKAGGLPPAIPATGTPTAPSAAGAQRRPGAYPRQSNEPAGRRCDGCRRSTKAGGLPPAIRRWPRRSRIRRMPLNEGRGPTPGNPRGIGRTRPALRSLNEGRGPTPGNPPACGR